MYILNNRYKICELINSGGFGKIYIGYDIMLDKQIAIKVEDKEKYLSNESDIYEKIKDKKINISDSYEMKMDTILILLHGLASEYIVFDENIDYFDIKHIEKEDNIKLLEKLILPKYNLVTNDDNEISFYKKVADFLIRFDSYNKYYLLPSNYLEDEYLNYNIDDNEILIYESLLNKDYFNSIKKMDYKNKNTKDTFMTSYPIINKTHPYLNRRINKPIDLDKVEENVLKLP